MLELPGQGFKTTVDYSKLRALLDKADSIQEHMGNAGREMEILRKTSVYLFYFPEPWNLKEMKQLEQCCSFLNVAESSFSLQSRILVFVHSFKRYYGAFVTCSALCLEVWEARETMALHGKGS